MNKFDSQFEMHINYFFRDKNLLYSALTHPSSRPSKFELLEFIGDRVLGMVVADAIWGIAPSNEYEYAKHFTALTNKQALTEFGYKMHLDRYVEWLGAQDHFKSIIVDATEAVMGAVYIDSDLNSVKELFKKFNSINIDYTYIDPKSSLNSWAGKNSQIIQYSVLQIKGLPHNRDYLIELKIGENSIQKWGKSIKEAEKLAAYQMLKKVVGIEQKDGGES